ncbi:hypothetical protein [Myroides odoratus]|uniref:hypothetical protein n=1 Tax=Myroides odoratus TaxID=256 RepID=UPI0039AFB28A
MIKNVIVIVLVVLSLNSLSAQVKDRPFPYALSLTGNTKPDEIDEHIENAPTGTDRYTKDGIVLTEDQVEFSFSGFYLNEIEFPSNHGIIVEFSYAMADGKKYGNSYGDGISMFLFDGQKDFSIGAPGASLGYANKNTSVGNQPGLNGAYLGLGLDVFGSYKLRGNNVNERREGIDGLTYKNETNHITLRGGQYKNDRYKGYPVLFTEQVEYGNESRPNIASASLNYNTGDYQTSTYSTPGFSELRTGYYFGDTYNYNRVEAKLIPINNGANGMKVSVFIKSERSSATKYPIRDFIYPNSFKTRDENGTIYNYETQVPSIFKVGFAGGTGGATQTQIIKDVVVNLPYAPITQDRDMLLCLTNGDDKNNSQSIVSPFSLDTFYVGTIDNPSSQQGERNVDVTSFRFEDENGFNINTGTRMDSNFYIVEYRQSGIGLWEYYYDRRLGNTPANYLYFTPETNNLPEGDYSVYYSAHSKDDGSNGPFAEHIYRCRPTKITVKARVCSAVVNPNLPIKVLLEE